MGAGGWYKDGGLQEGGRDEKEEKKQDDSLLLLTCSNTYIRVVRGRWVIRGWRVVGCWLVVQWGRWVVGRIGSHPREGEDSTHADLEGIGRVSGDGVNVTWCE